MPDDDNRVDAVAAQIRLDDARGQFQRRERELLAELEAARARIAALEGSTFWRFTAPLRAVAHRVKHLLHAPTVPPGAPAAPIALPRTLAAHGATRHRVLLIDAEPLTPDQDAGSLRATRLIEVMRAMGCEVAFACEQERSALDELLAVRGGELDIVILSRHAVAARHLEEVRRRAPRALVVFDTVDLHFVRERRRAELDPAAFLGEGAEAIYREEVACVRASDVTWAVSEREREIVLREVPEARVMVLATIHVPVAPVKPFAARAGLLLVGGFRHTPNVDAALHFARAIAPRLRRRLPGVATYIVGSGAPAALASLAVEGLEVVGQVPDMAPWLERCRVSVSPLRYGAGIKGKVGEALAHGLPVVATSVSVEGMGLADGSEVLVADDPDAFAAAVERLYADEALWARLSRAGIEHVARHFSPEAAAHALAPLLELAAARR
ncbi:MAG: glycosyltransferase [Usitatibacter sp.]